MFLYGYVGSNNSWKLLVLGFPKHSAFAFSTTQKSDTNEGICSIPYGRPKADMKTVVIR